MQEAITNFNKERDEQIKQNYTELKEQSFNELKSKIYDIYDQDDLPSVELVEIYKDLSRLTRDKDHTIYEESELHDLNKVIAREIQANPEALKLAKQDKLEEQLNNDADIDLSGDLVDRYKKLKEQVDQRNGLLLDITNEEKYEAEIKIEDNMYHLAKVINQDKSLHKELPSDLLQQINDISEEHTRMCRNDIDRMTQTKTRGYKIEWSLKE